MKRGHTAWLARIALLLVSTILSLELSLQIASLFSSDRIDDRLLGARKTVICLGDSNTYGVLVPATQTYPAYLQQFLDEFAPGEFAVINLGVPGMNSSQIRRRLGENLERFRPAYVVVWVGTNDIWNHMELGNVDQASREERVDGVLLHSRLYRFFRNLRQDRALHAGLKESEARGIREEIEVEEKGRNNRLAMLVRQGGRETHLVVATDPKRTKKNEHISERTYLELRQIDDQLRKADAQLVLLRYPLDFHSFKISNFAIQTYATDADVPLVNTTESLRRVPKEDVEWLYGNHPNPPVYREIARDVAQKIIDIAIARGQ